MDAEQLAAEQAAFEEWARDNGFALTVSSHPGYPALTAVAWKGWLARASLTSASGVNPSAIELANEVERRLRAAGVTLQSSEGGEPKP